MIRRSLILFFIMLMPLSGGCQLIQASDTASSQQATVVKSVKGSQFNKFFPEDEGDYDVVYTQEKEGFAEAVLNENGSEVATLAVTDTANNPSARIKYGNSSEKIAGYPAVAVGSSGTALLVANRFQVQVRSKETSFTADDRAEWLQKFDLAGIAGLK